MPDQKVETGVKLKLELVVDSGEEYERSSEVGIRETRISSEASSWIALILSGLRKSGEASMFV